MTSSRTYGYIRVSTAAQNLDRQKDALTALGIEEDHIFHDKLSGAREDRPGLKALLREARPGDSITVHSLDRLGRSTLHVMQTLANLENANIRVVSLKEGDQTYTGATGKFMRDIMVLVATWEREMNRERVAEARAAKAARAAAGEQIAGRPRTALSADKIAAVRKRHDKGMSASDIAAAVGISRASVYRALSAV